MFFEPVINLSLILIGLCMGSFAGASVWRLRSRQLVEDKQAGEEVDLTEYKKLSKLSKKSIKNDRSCCLSCGYELKWYDLIPLFSWLFLLGKCRKCRKPIGIMEPLIEILMALFFILSYIFWPGDLNIKIEVVKLVIWLISGVVLAILFVYDAKWYLLPDFVSYFLAFLGIINAIIIFTLSENKISSIISIFGAVFILSGIYLILYLISKGRWIGFGDIKLGIGLALLLSDWKLALIALFMANLFGCLVVLPSLIIGKMNRGSHVPFGPFLIIGMIAAKFLGEYVISFFYI